MLESLFQRCEYKESPRFFFPKKELVCETMSTWEFVKHHWDTISAFVLVFMVLWMSRVVLSVVRVLVQRALVWVASKTNQMKYGLADESSSQEESDTIVDYFSSTMDDGAKTRGRRGNRPARQPNTSVADDAEEVVKNLDDFLTSLKKAKKGSNKF